MRPRILEIEGLQSYKAKQVIDFKTLSEKGLFGIFWPTFIAVAMTRFGSNAPVMTSAMIAIAGLLNAGIQLVMGYINRWIGTGWGYRSCLVFALILFCLLLGINQRLKKLYSKDRI